MKLIGEILMEHGLLDQKDLDKALDIQKSSEDKKPLGEVLVSLGIITIDSLMDYLDLQLKEA